MDLNLKDKVVIVTGGAKGIGEGIVRAIADEDGIPVIVGRSKQAADALVHELKEQNKKCFSIHRELSMAEDCLITVETTLEEFGRIDALINNAGRNDGIGLEDGHPEAFLRSIQGNLYHYYNMAHFCLPELKKNKGSILNISSKIALTGQGGSSADAASKGAQLALTREWAVELLKYEVRVNAIIPAEVMTPLYQRWINGFDNPVEKLNSIQNMIPLGKRMTTTQEIADMATFLISNRASHITGQFIAVDGGYINLDRASSILQ